MWLLIVGFKYLSLLMSSFDLSDLLIKCGWVGKLLKGKEHEHYMLLKLEEQFTSNKIEIMNAYTFCRKELRVLQLVITEVRMTVFSVLISYTTQDELRHCLNWVLKWFAGILVRDVLAPRVLVAVLPLLLEMKRSPVRQWLWVTPSRMVREQQMLPKAVAMTEWGLLIKV